MFISCAVIFLFFVSESVQQPPVIVRRGAEVFHLRTQAYCPNGYWLLSCGMYNAQRNRVDRARSWYPISDSACYCTDSGGATCQASCADVNVGLRIVNSGPVKGFSEANCPSGTVVIGCHMKASGSLEYWKSFSPRYGYCKCYDGQGASECIATCASSQSISDYSIQSQQGKGTIKVVCGGRGIALGCGYMPFGTGILHERFRDVSIQSPEECTCFDHFGGTCYAICGTIKRA